MTLTDRLPSLIDAQAFPHAGDPTKRWGQILREGSQLGSILAAGAMSGALVPLRDVAELRGGVVTRANAYFIVRELPYGQIPKRFRLTRRDYEKVAVVADGLDTAHRIEREHLRPVLKGPDSLTSPTSAEVGDLRLFNVEQSVEDLREKRHTGAIAYINRGTRQPYRVSADRLKGGIPAERSNIKNRTPFWYSLSVPDPKESPRIVLPEHIDRQYPATLLPPEKREVVVLDKLFVATPSDPAHGLSLLLGLNSMLTWAQLELRGRTQLGQGVLEVKKSDWLGILVMNPDLVDPELLETFAPISDDPRFWRIPSLELEERRKFDLAYLSKLAEEAELTAQAVEMALVSSAAERHERAASVKELQGQRKRQRRVATSVDAHAARLAALLQPYPDPRDYVEGRPTRSVSITPPGEGVLNLGQDLFTAGTVLAGDVPIASPGDMESARFVLGALLHDPDLDFVEVPEEAVIDEVIQAWDIDGEEWLGRFETVGSEALSGIASDGLREAIRARAMTLLHAPVDLP